MGRLLKPFVPLILLGMLIGALLSSGCEKDNSKSVDSQNADDPTDSSGDDYWANNGQGKSGSGELDQCAALPWNVEPKPINLLILLDRSKSMSLYNAPGTDDSYAQVVADALKTLVKDQTEAARINFALNVFPSPTMCSNDYGNLSAADQTSAVTCQAASQFVNADNPFEEPLVPFSQTISNDTINAISTALDEVGTCGGTPITRSLKWARIYLDSIDLEGPKVVLLATDGAPMCSFGQTIPCRSATPGVDAIVSEQCLDDLDSVHAAFDLVVDGVRVFVVGVGEDVQDFSDVMDALAYAGGGHMDGTESDIYDITAPPSSEHWYYPAADGDRLKSALDEVTNQAQSCAFEVDWATIPSEDPETGSTVIKSCSKVRVMGSPQDGADPVAISYMPGCSGEDPTSDDPVHHYGWVWKELAQSDFDDIEAMGADTSGCGTIQLCPAACNMLKLHNGETPWHQVSATFGCQPIIIID